jgi:hypothetical protein
LFHASHRASTRYEGTKILDDERTRRATGVSVGNQIADSNASRYRQDEQQGEKIEQAKPP